MANFKKTLTLALALVAGSAGCDVLSLLYGDTGDAPLQPPVATTGTAAWKVDVGTGDRSFAPLADGDTVAKQSGSQGGYHFWVSLRIDGTTPDHLQIEIEVDAPDTVVSRSASIVAAPADDAGPTTKTLTGLRAFVDKGTSGPLLLKLKVIDPSNRNSVSAQRNVVLH